MNNIEFLINMTELTIAKGEYEIRYIDNNRKIIFTEIIESSPYTIQNYLKDNINGKYVSPLISSNPVSEKELWIEEDTFTKDEKRIKEVKRIVLDIDYPHEDNNYLVIRTLIDEFGVSYSDIVDYISPSGKIHIYINVNQGNLSTVEAIKICKVFYHKLNNILKEKFDMSIDDTFLHNFGHYIFAEDFFLPIKDNRKSVLYMPKKLRDDELTEFNLLLWRDYLNEYENFFQKAKSKKNKGNKKSSRYNGRVTLFSKQEQEDILRQINTLNKLDDFSTIINRKASLNKANIGYYFNNMKFYFNKEINQIDFNSIKESKLYRDLLKSEQDRELTAFARWFTEGLSFFKKKLYKLCYYDTIYKDNKNKDKDRTTYRFQNVIYPTVQMLVDIFGFEYVLSSRLYYSVIDVFYAHNGKIDKDYFVEDLDKAFKYVIEDNVDRIVDDDYRKLFIRENENSFIMFIRFLEDILTNNIGYLKDNRLIIDKKEIKDKYNMTKREFAWFKQILNEYKRQGMIYFKDETRFFEFVYVVNPFVIFYYETLISERKKHIGRFDFDYSEILKNLKDYFMNKYQDSRITVLDKPITDSLVKLLFIKLIKMRKKVEVNVIRKVLQELDLFLEFYLQEVKKAFSNTSKHLLLNVIKKHNLIAFFIHEFIEEVNSIYEACSYKEKDKVMITATLFFINNRMPEFLSKFVKDFNPYKDFFALNIGSDKAYERIKSEYLWRKEKW